MEKALCLSKRQRGAGGREVLGCHVYAVESKPPREGEDEGKVDHRSKIMKKAWHDALTRRGVGEARRARGAKLLWALGTQRGNLALEWDL